MTLFLVRHASAGTRRDGDPDDRHRHLDEVGLRQAVQLGRLMKKADVDPTPISLIKTSPAARCVETVAPLAAALGRDIELEPLLYESSDVGDTWKLVRKLAKSGASAVLCSHGDVIPEIVHLAKGRGMEVRGKTGCAKGSIWRLDWDGERFATGSYLPNPG